MTKEVKLTTMHKSLGFTMPIKAVELLGLCHKQRMLLYVNRDKIIVKPMEPGEPKPPYLCWTRKLYLGETRRFLIVPPAIIDMFKIKAGDRLAMDLAIAGGEKILMMVPIRPTMRVRVTYDGDQSVIEIYKLTHDGQIDTSQDPVIRKVPYSKAYSVERSLKEKDKEALERELDASKPLDIAVPDDYVPEVFANEDQVSATVEGKEDVSGDV